MRGKIPSDVRKSLTQGAVVIAGGESYIFPKPVRRGEFLG